MPVEIARVARQWVQAFTYFVFSTTVARALRPSHVQREAKDCRCKSTKRGYVWASPRTTFTLLAFVPRKCYFGLMSCPECTRLVDSSRGSYRLLANGGTD
jgi:hypothetical protein